jgi:hypothetical protein
MSVYGLMERGDADTADSRRSFLVLISDDPSYPRHPRSVERALITNAGYSFPYMHMRTTTTSWFGFFQQPTNLLRPYDDPWPDDHLRRAPGWALGRDWARPP